MKAPRANQYSRQFSFARRLSATPTNSPHALSSSLPRTAAPLVGSSQENKMGARHRLLLRISLFAGRLPRRGSLAWCTFLSSRVMSCLLCPVLAKYIPCSLAPCYSADRAIQASPPDDMTAKLSYTARTLRLDLYRRCNAARKHTQYGFMHARSWCAWALPTHTAIECPSSASASSDAVREPSTV